jgi:hypothetical protein
MNTTIRFDRRGGIDCLYTELLDLRTLGRLHVVRATEITFEEERQRWEVRCADSGKLLFSDSSRANCVEWEQTNLQPGTPVPTPNNPKSTSIMKLCLIIAVAVVAILVACGPDKAKLRTELQSIDKELVQIQTVAEQYRARMSAAEFDTFIGSFAAGYGAVSGDDELTVNGFDAAVESTVDYDTSSISLEQLKQRRDQLAKRRADILSKLD